MTTFYTIIISISFIITTIFLISILRKKPKNQLQQIFSVDIILLFVLSFFVLCQLLFSERLNIPPVYFDYFAYICACFFPISIIFTSLIFVNTKIKFKKSYLLLFVIPILSLLVLWTNDLHHLFYVEYSINLKETVFGPYFNVHSIYSYVCLAIGLFYLLYYTIKNSGFFSRQSILIILGTVIPVIINALATFGVITSTIYITPITFFIGISFYYLAIFKFQFLKVSPIALQRVVDQISDSYLVLNESLTIIDFNLTFLNTFGFSPTVVRNCPIYELLDKANEPSLNKDTMQDLINKALNSKETVRLEKELKNIHKYFNIEISSITHKGNILGVLILFKDITQHILDLQTIHNNQDLLMEKERLASLGQLIGGIAHNLKTPIMSIAGAAEGLSDLVKEYDASIEDAEVTAKDHHDIAKDMKEWVEKVKTHTSYMSDVITAVKGQAVALSEEQANSFTLDELVKRVNILMKHELKNALIELNIHMDTDSTLSLNGNINSLVQVINNMISNAIQAYNGEPNQMIDMYFHVENNMLTIAIEDHGMGMSEEVQHKLFKEMITTKGKNGTGLGLFMSYSNIRGHFNGNITFESEKGKGTVFNIILPL